jgi:protein TonB
MPDARFSLAIALAVSVALHLSLILGVTVRSPAPLASPLLARLQPEAQLHGSVPPDGFQASRALLLTAPANARPQAVPSGPVPATERGGEPAGPVALPAPPPDTALPSVAMPLLADPTWYSAKELDLYPRAREPVQPAYPERAAQEGMAGEVTLLLEIDERGAVREASVARAAPEGYFEEAAVAAFADARFTPAQKDGRSVRSRVLVRVSFDPLALAERQAPAQTATNRDE